jgi:hypothetical protein
MEPHNIRTPYDVDLEKCHAERSAASNSETLRCAQGDIPGVLISCGLT